MLSKHPIVIESISLESSQASSDGFNYVSAVYSLTLRGSISSDNLTSDEIAFLQESADKNMRSLIGKEKPRFLGILDSGEGKYKDLCLLNVQERGDRVLLALRSLTFRAIGTEEEVRQQIIDTLKVGANFLEVSYVD